MAIAALARAGSRMDRLVSRRGFAADHHHGPVKVNMWEAPGSLGTWKEEHFVFASLGGWGALFFAGYKAATGGSKKEKDSAAKPEKATGGSKKDKDSAAKPEKATGGKKEKDSAAEPEKATGGSKKDKGSAAKPEKAAAGGSKKDKVSAAKPEKANKPPRQPEKKHHAVNSEKKPEHK